ncbi:LacI family DNA-binding transcriptional regulator [Pararhizobium sp. YC-54]|uniref:LacI family DNA-binding transcriptional regulator n=1 Tax=Pararhizobium sp. YC-54 TaxID=2986920 RepID=UPI0021F7CBC7|nr:LacI family DNA-binding transcriptional regulator [Pararhizobium sp. YC-54]MCW0001543.1 LacI family DNA-binding transcriptional regulator [Pararhizobium sp. YC-54]
MAAGVSVGTVDRVINARGSVQPETEALVMHWARELRLDRALHQRPTRILRLGVLLLNRSDPFLEALVRGLQKAVLDYRYLNLQVRVFEYGKLDARHIVEKISMVEQTCDGVAINAFDDPAIRLRLAEFTRHKPVFTLISDLPDLDRIAFIGASGQAEGRVAGELMARFLGPAGGQILLISGPGSFLGHGNRELGFRTVLMDRFPSCTVCKSLQSFEDKRIIRRQVSLMLKQHPEISGVYNTSVGSEEVGDALSDLGREHSTVFITHELTEENRRMLQSGILDAVIDQDPIGEARMLVQSFLSFYGRLEAERTETGFRIYIRESCSL